MPTLQLRLEISLPHHKRKEFDFSSPDPLQNGLMVAVGKGFVDIVTVLHVCPLIDINHQDNDGNTALMIAAQAGWYGGGLAAVGSAPRVGDAVQLYTVDFLSAGFINILNYIVNFYADVDTEVRDPRGFTALIKAGLQGREECVSALLMHGKFFFCCFFFAQVLHTQNSFAC